MLKQLTVCLSIMTTTAWSADYVLDIKNQTKRPLHYIYVSHVQDEVWEEDLLNLDEFLEPEGHMRLTLTHYDSPYFDVRAIDDQGHFYYRYRVNAQQSQVEFTPLDRVTNTKTNNKINQLK